MGQTSFSSCVVDTVGSHCFWLPVHVGIGTLYPRAGAHYYAEQNVTGRRDSRGMPYAKALDKYRFTKDNELTMESIVSS
ncbi:hypothetical protein PQR39_41405 [Paraburkholderia sediminicola]|uniref:hypothetical protein n=1 Tax=Paraburkholderia sediminicola TaxID=458836 RepID=UPI0038B712F3